MSNGVPYLQKMLVGSRSMPGREREKERRKGWGRMNRSMTTSLIKLCVWLQNLEVAVLIFLEISISGLCLERGALNVMRVSQQCCTYGTSLLLGDHLSTSEILLRGRS